MDMDEIGYFLFMEEQEREPQIIKDIPKAFWKYYDLFRRNQLSIVNFSRLSGLSESDIQFYLAHI